MKRLLLISLSMACCLTSWGWGGTGHKAIAEIAYKYLDSNAKNKINSCFGSKATYITWSTYPDSKRYNEDWWRDLGQEISNPEILWPGKTHDEVMAILKNVTRYEPWCHSFTVDDKFYCLTYNIVGTVYHRNGVMDINTIAEALRTKYDSLTAEQKKQYLALIVHLIGDIHCPMHTLYVPDAPKGGAFSINITDAPANPYEVHAFWDNTIFTMSHEGWTYSQFASKADDCTEPMRQIIVSGSVSDWGRFSALYCWQCQMYNGKQMSSGTTVSSTYPTDMEPVLMHQLRDAGYRLAELLNSILK